MENVKIDNIQRAKYGKSGKEVKIFKAFKFSSEHNAYIYAGQYVAPIKTANKNLHKYID